MRIGSFFSVLFVALVALGFLLSDTMHLRDVLNKHQKEIEELTAALQKTEQEKQRALEGLQKAEQEKQNALVNLENTSHNLFSCRQEVDQTKQLVVRLTNEISALKEQNYLLTGAAQSTNTTGDSAHDQSPIIQATDFSLIALLAAGFGSVVLFGLKSLLNQVSPKTHADKTGSYVYLTHEEIKELAHLRRTAGRTNSPHSN